MQPADIYLIDEPSAYLDSEQRIVASKVIKRFILHAKKTAFVVEHDFIMATYLADKVIVYEGKPSIDCIANAPQSLVSGMNRFLSVSSNSLFAFLYVSFRENLKFMKSDTDIYVILSAKNFLFMVHTGVCVCVYKSIIM